MPGPARTPTPILKARGSWHANGRAGEMSLPVEKPSCPSWLKAEAKAEWRRIVGQLVNAGVLSKIDRALLADFCQAWGEYVEANKMVDREGHTITTTNGNIVYNPWLSVRNKASARMLQLAQQFGLSPAARSRIKGHEPAEEADGKARFFNVG